MRKRYHNAPRTQPFFRARLRQRRPAEQEAAPSSPRHDNRPEELTCPFKIHNLAKERRRIHAYQTIQKESSGDRRHLMALGIMFFLFFMHPHSQEGS